MSKLKVLTQDDLATISDDFGEILKNEVSKALPSKEIEDLDLDIVLDYKDNQLDVDVDVGVSFDELSDITQEQIFQAIDEEVPSRPSAVPRRCECRQSRSS